MKRLLLLSVILVAACGRDAGPPPDIVVEHRIVAPQSHDDRTDQEKRRQTASSERWAETNRLLAESHKAGLIADYGIAAGRIHEEFERRGGENSVEALEWLVDLYKGRSVEEVIAVVDSWD